MDSDDDDDDGSPMMMMGSEEALKESEMDPIIALSNRHGIYINWCGFVAESIYTDMHRYGI